MARRFAEQADIDLSGAYSVLLKIMTLDEVRALRVDLIGEVSRPVVETLTNMAYMAGKAGDDARDLTRHLESYLHGRVTRAVA